MDLLRTSSSLSLLVFGLFLGGCPNDLVDGSGGTDGTTTSLTSGVDATSGADVTSGSDGSTSSADSTATDGSSTGEPTPEPLPLDPVDCSSEYTALSTLPAVVHETPVDQVPASLCAGDFNVPADYEIHVYRPDPWPTGASPRPWVLLQHGSQQNPEEYQHLVDPLVERGFVVFAPDLPGSAEVADHVRCSLRWIREEYAENLAAGLSPLGECYAMIGHSRGGGGVVRAAQLEQEEGGGGPVGAIITMAPTNLPDEVQLLAERSFAYLSLMGTTDAQNPDGGFDAYERLADEARLDIAAGEGSVAGRYGDKALVTAYGARHNSWGGFPPPMNQADLRGRAVSEGYGVGFLEWQLFGNTSARRLFTDGDLPAAVAASTSWSSHPQQVGTEPLILTTHQLGNRRDVGVQRLNIATLEDPGSAFIGDGMGGSLSPGLMAAGSLGRRQQDQLYPGLDLLATLQNDAMRINWDRTSDFTGEVTWTFPQPDSLGTGVQFTPLHLSFRVHNVFDGWTDPSNCIPETTEGPLYVDVRLQDESGDSTVRVSNIISQDYSDVPAGYQGPDPCARRQTLHTVRIPISCFPTLDPDTLNSVQFQFGNDPAGPATGSLILDSIELTRSDEDVGASVDCSNFPFVTNTTSFLCGYYDPAEHVEFTTNPGAGPGDPEGVITMDGSFARYVAGRPEMVTGCDDARYELDTVSADEDSDGTADETHDVRSLQGVAASDLVAQLGLEEGDAAITINEPGKPDTNGVELYDYASFLAA